MNELLIDTLEQKIAKAVEIIEQLKRQIERLESENGQLRSEQERWRTDLNKLVTKFDALNVETADVETTEAEESFVD